MATAAEAAREYATGPQVVEAARVLLSRFPLPTLCEALANARSEDADSLVEALERLAEVEEVREAFLAEELTGFLQQGAAAPDPRVRRLVARLLARLAQGGTARLAAAGLLGCLEPLLLDSETGTSEGASRALVLAAGEEAVRAAVLDVAGRLLAQLNTVGDVERVRILGLFVELGRASANVFLELEARGAYREVLASFLTDDLLLKLNAVELLDALGSYPAGQDLLSKENLPQRLAAELDFDPIVRLCVARLLGRVCRRQPALMGLAAPTAPLGQALPALLGGGPDERLCGLGLWADLACCEAGLALVVEGEASERALALAGAASHDQCKAALAAWAEVLHAHAAAAAPGAEGPGQRLWAMAEARLLPQALKGLTTKPFPDVRVLSWHLLAALCASRSCAQKIVPSEEMRELLLDFSSEQGSDPRRAKHEFVLALHKHRSWLNAFLDEEAEGVLNEYARQGPHWVPRAAAAAVGGGDAA